MKLKLRWSILAAVVIGLSGAGVGYLFRVGHPFADTLTWEWLRDALTSVSLIAVTALAGGIVVGWLQHRWVTKRTKAEKEWDLQRDVYRRAIDLLSAVLQARELYAKTDQRDPATMTVDRAIRAEGHRLLSDATGEASRLIAEAELAFGVVPEAINALATIAAVGQHELIRLTADDLTEACEAAKGLPAIFRGRMTYGRKPPTPWA